MMHDACDQADLGPGVSEVLGRVPMILAGCCPAAALASYPVDSAG